MEKRAFTENFDEKKDLFLMPATQSVQRAYDNENSEYDDGNGPDVDVARDDICLLQNRDQTPKHDNDANSDGHYCSAPRNTKAF